MTGLSKKKGVTRGSWKPFFHTVIISEKEAEIVAFLPLPVRS